MSSFDKPSGGDQDPDKTPEPERRPFPGQPGNRPFAPPPTGYRSFDQIRAERAAEAKAAADRDTARTADRPAPGQPAAKETGQRGKDAPPAKPAADRDAGRDDAPREQGRSGRDQDGTRPGQAQAETREQPAEKPRAETPPARKETPSAPDAGPPPADGHPQPGHAPPAPDVHRPGDKTVITYAHAEFHGQKFGAYTDGTHWVSEEAVRAMARKNDQSKTPERHGIADVPQQRDLGDNTVGENPNVQLGDTTDLRTFGEQMTGEGALREALDKDEEGNSWESKAGRALDAAMEHGDDFHDLIGNGAETAKDFFLRGPGPTGTHALHSDHPGYEAAPSQGLNASDAIGGTVLLTAAGLTAVKHAIQSHGRNQKRDHPRH